MLPKKLRLDSKDIPNLAYKGNKEVSNGLHVRYSPSDTYKFGISISTRVDSRATIRNKIKRKIRANLAIIVKTKNLPTGKYLIIVKSPKIAEAGYPIFDELVETLTKAGKSK